MVELFLDYLRYERNRSSLTVARYERTLRDFQTYFQMREASLTWTTVDADLIRGWVETLMDKGNKATSINADLAALRSFFRFALSRKLLERNPAYNIVGPKKQKSLPQFVKERDLDRLLDEQKETCDDFNNVRARTIIILLYETGLRRSELVGLDDRDLDFVNSQLKVTGKRNKQRYVPFGEEVAETLKHYIEVRDQQMECSTTALFVGKNGERISGAKVYQIVKEQLSKVTFMKKRSPHVLRHSFATAMLNHGAGLEDVRKLLGHESVQTTEIYTHTTFEQMKRVYKDAHPRGDE